MPRSRLLLAGSALYATALAVVALWPTHVDSGYDVVDTFVGRWLLDRGLTVVEAYRLIEFWANVALYVPLGVLAMMLSARSRWWQAVTLAVVVSGAFEVLQAVARPGRTASVDDVVANTLGAAVGAAAAVAVRAFRRRGTAPSN